MYRIAIVEDDEHYVKEIETDLRRYEREQGVAFQIRVFRDGEELVTDYPGDFDMILMDIELPRLDGMSAAEKIRRMDEEVEIIFITNSPQYAIRGYRVGALDYILKPVNSYAFSETITRALERRRRSGERYLVISVKGGKQKLDVGKIRFVEVRDHDLTFHTTEGDFFARGTIREIVEELQEDGFFHCNKGYLINLAFVDGITGQDVQIGEDTVPVGRTRKKAFMDAMNRYLGERGR